MEYREAVNYILEIPKFTKKNKPEHTKDFLSYLGNPERNLKVIHVAGTNGKGSVCTYLDAMLRAEGKKRKGQRVRVSGLYAAGRWIPCGIVHLSPSCKAK